MSNIVSSSLPSAISISSSASTQLNIDQVVQNEMALRSLSAQFPSTSGQQSTMTVPAASLPQVKTSSSHLTTGTSLPISSTHVIAPIFTGPPPSAHMTVFDLSQPPPNIKNLQPQSKQFSTSILDLSLPPPQIPPQLKLAAPSNLDGCSLAAALDLGDSICLHAHSQNHSVSGGASPFRHLKIPEATNVLGSPPRLIGGPPRPLVRIFLHSTLNLLNRTFRRKYCHRIYSIFY